MHSLLLKYILTVTCYHILPQKNAAKIIWIPANKIQKPSQHHQELLEEERLTNLPVPKEWILITQSLGQFTGYKETDNITKYSWNYGGQRGMDNGGNKITQQTPQTKHRVGLLLIYSQASCSHVWHLFAYLIGQIIQRHTS